MAFYNRERELHHLDRRFASRQPELFVLYGRRRTGKSALLREFCRGKAHVYFLASQVRELDNLRQLREALLDVRPDPLLAKLTFTDWDVALTYLGRVAAEERFIVVLDEFPYLCQENPALPSILQRWWDTIGKESQVFLMLSGSHIGFMEHEVLAERSPLYGRRTGQAKLGPLLPWDAGRFFPNYNARDRLTVYGILGGIPAYLERFNPSLSLRENVLREILDPYGFLFDEVHFLLRTELVQVSTYLSLLKAVAGGATRISEIASRAGISANAAPKYVGVLRDLGLLQREVPVTEDHPEKSKRGLYRIRDPFVSFWCRFVLPYQSLIQAGRGEMVWEEHIAPYLDTHLGLVFEEVCRLRVLHGGTALGNLVPRRVGRWWSGDAEVDLLAELSVDETRAVLAGECKWWKTPVGRNVLDDLRRRVGSLPTQWQSPTHLALFSASGFTDELLGAAEGERLLLIDADALMATTG
jgi:AAA+ ATPase superfamily predicted ATPase